MSKTFSSARVAALRVPATSIAGTRDDAAALPQLLAGYRRVLCAIEPDAGGRRILQRVALAMARDGRLGVVCAARFELPTDASACLFPTPLDRRARLIVSRQRELDQLVLELGLREADVFASAGIPSREIREVASLWRADLVLVARSARTGLRQRRGGPDSFDVAVLDDEGRIAPPSLVGSLFG